MIKETKRTDRPDGALHGTTRRIETDCGTLTITVNDHDGKPFEIIVRPGSKCGACQTAFAQFAGITVSRLLQHGVDAKDIIKSVGGIKCTPETGERSCAEAVAEALRRKG